MNNQYNNYVSEVQSLIKEKDEFDYLNSAIPLIKELNSVAEKNRGNLETFKGINNELSGSFDKSVNDTKKLNNLLSTSKKGFSKLRILKSKICDLEFHLTSIGYTFNLRVRTLINTAYNQMKISDIDSTQEEMSEMIAQMQQYKINKKLEDKKKRKVVIKITLIGIGILIGFYVLLAYIIPFVIDWWWAILIAAIGIGWIISKFD